VSLVLALNNHNNRTALNCLEPYLDTPGVPVLPKLPPPTPPSLQVCHYEVSGNWLGSYSMNVQGPPLW
jgi:hypothetical protein